MSEDVVSKIAEAENYKQQGNDRYKAALKDGNFKKALASYHKVFLYLNGLSMPGEKSQAAQYAEMMGRSASGSAIPQEKVEDVTKLKQSTHLNMAACYLKTAEHKKCVDSCSKALADGPLSKAFFRRGQANLELGNLDEAKLDFEQARDLEPSDPAIEIQLRRLKQAFSQHDAKEKKRFAKMFNKMQEENAKEEASAAADGAETNSPEAPNVSDEAAEKEASA
eukprot:TRINITY_DN84751_c0_g1_i1.p1 TRINITY_DN84751_c0_g1~~TRINITY_DN84751_c0_g1_i1.p1  ORF type:complete len:223 (-),score=71.85 TRINITY_DN84751_c0_g1_i1:87-755(-)